MSKQLSKSVGMRIADRYSITGVVGSGAMGLVYRAIAFEDPSHEVAIKIIQTGKRLSTSDLINFQKEAALMSQLYHNNIITFHELGLIEQKPEEGQSRFHSGYYIVMEIAEGLDLKEQLKRFGRKSIDEFFEIAIQTTDALDYTHGKNIIHRDIKPQNIIVNRTAEGVNRFDVKILDFGVARLAESMHFTGEPSSSGNGIDDVAGTPLYMAPEQSRLMGDVLVDHRIDLYSLGCVFYEILSGKPPFNHKTREKLQRAHAFEEPEQLRNLRPDIPPILEKIVFKLLEKNPDLRYQSAFGLLSDLHQARAAYVKKSNSIFSLGKKGKFKSVTAAINMVGRDAELDLLQSTYDSLNGDQARSRITVVQGSSGLGKTRILNAFRAYLIKRQVRFVSGSFSQHETSLPYNALANAFNDYLLKVLQTQPRETEALREKFRNVLGPAIFQIATVVPSILAFMDEDEAGDGADKSDVYDAYDSSSELEINPAFVKAFSDFTRCLATDNQPVVFIFDNLHWADDKSLQLVDEFFSYNNSQRFYLVVACRVEDAVAPERMEKFFAKFEKLRRRFNLIKLAALTVEDTRHICIDLLDDAASVGEDLVEALFAKTKGNPMHLVDQVKALVANDLISPAMLGNGWEYDIDRIRNYSLPYDTIDLVLSKIHDLLPDDKRQLQIAAAIGMSFPVSLLQAISSESLVMTEHALMTAQSLGIITLAIETVETDTISYRFRHRKARDAIYNSLVDDQKLLLHSRIADAILAAHDQLDGQLVYSVAHHLNRAVDLSASHTDLELAKKSLNLNIKAGERAVKSDSLLSAEKYFENALRLAGRFGKALISLEQYIWLKERMADLAEKRRNHGSALALYEQILTTRVPQEVWSRVAYKTIRLQSIGGIISKSMKQIKSALVRYRLPVPNGGLLEILALNISLLLEMLRFRRGRGRIAMAMGRLKHSIEKGRIIIDQFQSPADFYHMGSQIEIHENLRVSLGYHHQAWKQMGSASSNSLVFNVLLYRACLYATVGFKKTSYQIFDQLFHLMQRNRDRHMYGLVCLYKSLTIDYVNARFEEVETNSLRSLKYISTTRGRQHFGWAILLRSYISMERGNLAEAVKYCQYMTDIVPTRSPLIPRAFALNMYVFLLKGARDSIVRYGDYLIKRRSQVSARQDDLFMYISQCMIFLARGEFENVRKNFIYAVESFTGKKRSGFLFPFEEEFVGLFLCTFPMIFEQEVGKRIMNDQEIAAFNSKLHQRIFDIRIRNSAIFLLLRARFEDIAGGGGVRRLYDEAIRRANENNNKLALAFGYLWFGEHFLRGRNQNKIHYVNRAMEVANQYGINSLSDFIKAKYQNAGIQIPSGEQQGGDQVAKSQFSDATSPLVVTNLRTLSEALSEPRAVSEDVAEILRNLESEYTFDLAYVVTLSGDQAIIFQQTKPCTHAKQVVEYLEPYINIRSTLFLPAADAPWQRPGASVDAERTQPGTDSNIILMPFNLHEQFPEETDPTQANQDVERTIKVQHDSTIATVLPSTKLQTMVTGSATYSRMNIQKVAMNAILPIRYLNGNVGVLFLESIVEKQKGRDVQRRVELDIVAAQLGVLLVQKGGMKAVRNQNTNSTLTPDLALIDNREVPAKLRFSPGTIQLEKVDWMRIWDFGKPRTSRESVWYLGVNLGESKYLLVFTQILGPADIRDRINSMLWNQLIVQRSLSSLTSSETVTPEEIRDLFASILRSVEEFGRMEAVSIAFSLFDRKEQSMSGGHFGSARPQVLGVENKMTPYNEVVINFQSGRELRYWDVSASMVDQHPYLLSYDTTHLSLASEHDTLRTFREEARQSKDRIELHDALERAVRGVGLPRYYVASVIFPPPGRLSGKRDKIDLVG